MKKYLLTLAVLVVSAMSAWAQITALSDLTNTSSYTVKSVNRGFLYYDSNNGDYVTSSSHKDLVNATPTGEENELFAFLRTNKTAEGNYYLFSKSANKFVTYKGTGVALELTDAPEHAWTVAANGAYFTIKVPETEQTYINITNWEAKFGCKVFSTGADEGNKMTIKKVGDAEDFAAALAMITELETIVTLSYTITDAAGNVFEGTYEASAETEPTFTGVAGYTLSDKKWDGNKFTATITFPFPVSKDGGVTNATMISNFNVTQRWHAVGDDVKVQTQDVDPAKINEWLWAIYPSLADGKFTFVVKNMSTGTYLFTDKTESSFDKQGTVVLKEEGTPLEVVNWLNAPCFTVSGKTLYLTINGTADTDVYLATYVGGNNSHNGNKLHFPSYTLVSLNEAGYASTYLPFAAALPEGLEAYAVTATSATKATLTALQGIKANQGAILKGAASAEYVLAAGNVTSDWSGNLLKGSATDTEVTGAGYVLSTVNSVTGFYAAKLADGKFQNNAGKAYLPASAVTAGARFLSFDFGTETAIENIEGAEDAANAVVYDLSGRRVQKTQKGLYIVNGKVVIK